MNQTNNYEALKDLYKVGWRKLIDKYSETILKTVAAITAVGGAIGGVILYLYCNRIGFYPQELSTGDSLLYFLSCLGFFIVYLTIAITFLFLSLPFSYFAFKGFEIYFRKNEKPLDYGYFDLFPNFSWFSKLVGGIFIFLYFCFIL